MIRSVLAGLLTMAMAAPAMAEQIISDRAAFVSAVGDRTLSRQLQRFTVRSDGSVSGTASGRELTGNWDWQDGMLCWNLRWGGRLLQQDCQSVAVEGGTVLLTARSGAGQTAAYRIE
ncbi:dihydrodipicolinate reductase [Aestuariibius sp. 2305UL40-4]|uniref:dihydrodipicolinate reductase n=1 Tax=Aestuariibius violaceus TaxID=3234132 RepID=UPI00345E82D3